MTRSDVVVVGGGAVGVSCALELARTGASVTLLETGPSLGSGCSSGNAALLCPSHAVPLATRAALRRGLRFSLARDGPLAVRPHASLVPWLARFVAACTPERERAATGLLQALSLRSLALHRALDEELGVGLAATGTLNVFETEAGFETARHEAAEHAAAGMPCEVLDGAEACAAEPALVGPVAGAVFYPDELSGDPLEFVNALAAAAQNFGATIETGREALWLRRRGRRIEAVETTAGPLLAGTVVLAAGAWTPALVRGLGVAVPVEGGKGYHLEFEAVRSDPQAPLFLREAHVVATPLPGRLRLAGTLELAGLDASVDPRRLGAIESAGIRRVRGLQGRRATSVWRGLRPCSPDGLPILGAPACYDNLLLATGHGMLGFTLAPVTGQIVARLAAGGRSGADLDLLDPDRFASFLHRALRLCGSR